MEIIIIIILGAIVVLLIGSIIYSILDESMAKKGGKYDAVVIQRDYTPEADSTGVGPAIGGNGERKRIGKNRIYTRVLVE